MVTVQCMFMGLFPFCTHFHFVEMQWKLDQELAAPTVVTQDVLLLLPVTLHFLYISTSYPTLLLQIDGDFRYSHVQR